MKPFSKKMLVLDYIIMMILLVILIIFAVANGIYVHNITQQMLNNGMDVSAITVPFDISTLVTICSVFAAQLAVSSGAYYMMSKSDHKIQLPMEMLNTMPNEIKEQLDMTQVITTVLSTTDN